MLRSVGAKCDGEVPNDLEQRENMLPTPDAKGKPETAANPAGKQEKLDAKPKTSEDDPKPRIVLTFRSEKTGTRSNNMKIVSSEEKHEEISPRRSSRIRVPVMWDSEEESEFATPKRSTRRRSKEFSDSVIANAIARKEKYNEPGPTQRPYRRIKPTSKVLGNKELRWLQSAYNSQEADLIERWEDGVMTRRSARRKSFEAVEEKKSDRGYDEEEDMEGEEMELEGESEVQSHNVKKLKHLCELGLRAINPTGIDESSQDGKDGDEDMDADIDEDQELDEELTASWLRLRPALTSAMMTRSSTAPRRNLLPGSKPACLAQQSDRK
ncbi:hypothetical protein MSG28_012529 [Choristoneura fumiferana]|uniref:Uncharacterized protein n=1 Tax=Choristoneura fumiferana TaxID=7141 RepID=A0ACC0KDT8_CHOFU|nr:hypothetical protein MSG28_012529 [Choristoneura fumiferana]